MQRGYFRKRFMPRVLFELLKRHFLRRRYSGAKDLRLHLGCGDEYWPGYVNVDTSSTVRCDLCMDFTRIGEVFEDRTVSELVMIHSLSYLRLWQARDLFQTLNRLLAPGGHVVIELPDLLKCAHSVIEHEGSLTPYIEGVRGLYAFGVDEIEGRRMFTPYAFGWSGWHLRKELEQVGFTDVTILEPRTHDHPWRDIRVEAQKPRA